MRLRPVTPPPHAALIVTLTMLLALGPLTIDVFLPALPTMQLDLHATESAIQLTLTGASIGFGFGQLWVGPLSDSVGRRPPLLIATAAHVAASVGVALSSNVVELGTLRLVQGMSCTAASVVAVAIVRDLYHGRRFIKASADLSAVAGMAPAASTLIGSGVLLLVSWRWLAVGVAAYGFVAVLIAAVLIPETLEHHRRHGIGIRSLVDRYKLLIRDRRYLCATLIGMMCWSIHFSNLAASPFLLQRVHHLGVGGYGIAFAGITLVMLLSSQAASRILIPRYGATPLVPIFGAVAFVGAVAVIVDFISWPASLAGLLVPVMIVTASSSAAMTCAGLVGIAGHRDQAGTAISLGGALNFISGGIVTAIVGLAGVATPVGMAVVMITAAAVVVAISFVLRRVGDPTNLAT